MLSTRPRLHKLSGKAHRKLSDNASPVVWNVLNAVMSLWYKVSIVSIGKVSERRSMRFDLKLAWIY